MLIRPLLDNSSVVGFARELVASVVASVESRLSGNGRLLVRYSGTEPLLRVMLEGQDPASIRQWGQEIIDVVKHHLG